MASGAKATSLPTIAPADLTADDRRILAALAEVGRGHYANVWQADHARLEPVAVRRSLRRLVAAGLARYDPREGKGVRAVYIYVGEAGVKGS